MRIQGSIMPQMIIPLLVVGGWATLITCISHFWHNREFHLNEVWQAT